jgi:hypothetical protein
MVVAHASPLVACSYNIVEVHHSPSASALSPVNTSLLEREITHPSSKFMQSFSCIRLYHCDFESPFYVSDVNHGYHNARESDRKFVSSVDGVLDGCPWCACQGRICSGQWDNQIRYRRVHCSQVGFETRLL